MPPWRKLFSTFENDRKIRKLSAKLGIPYPYAAGLISVLWAWALSHAEDGDLTKFDVDEIEYGAQWPGDEGVFMEACVSVRLIDRFEDGRLLIHSWMKYGGSYAERKRKQLERQRKKTQQEYPEATDNDSELSENVQDSPGLSRTVRDCPRLSENVLVRGEERRGE